MREVEAFVLASGFVDLKAEYGAPADQRFYPFRITVRFVDGTTREVLFRSNPDFEGKPEAFTRLETFLLELTAD